MATAEPTTALGGVLLVAATIDAVSRRGRQAAGRA
jgi:hypothetical protein